MKILYINCIEYDYLTATLIEGLAKLGHEVFCTRSSNYGKAIPAAKIPAVADVVDLIIIGSNRGVDYHLLENVGNTRVVAVDGSDHATFQVPKTIRVKAVFKREICAESKGLEAGFIYPLPFAAEDRYFATPVEKDILVSFAANMQTNPIRNSIHTRLINKKHPAIFSGSTNESAYSWETPQSNAIATPKYQNLLARSQISISAPGAGYDCARYWEILAAKAMLLTYAPDIAIPNGFTSGVNCVTFSSMREFEDHLDFYVSHPSQAAEIANAGHRHLLAYHTTAHRAAYFLELAVPAANRTGFCDRFYAGREKKSTFLAGTARRGRSLLKLAHELASGRRPP